MGRSWTFKNSRCCIALGWVLMATTISQPDLALFGGRTFKMFLVTWSIGIITLWLLMEIGKGEKMESSSELSLLTTRTSRDELVDIGVCRPELIHQAMRIPTAHRNWKRLLSPERFTNCEKDPTMNHCSKFPHTRAEMRRGLKRP